MDALGKTLFCAMLILVGSAAWIVAERFRLIEPMCLVTDEIYTGMKR